MSAARGFETGDPVRVLEGPFRGFMGVVSGYHADADRLEITLPVFGRQTPIMLEREHVERIP